MKYAPKRWHNLLLLALVSSLSVWLADRVFIAYERSQLVPRLPAIDATGPVNLSALRYNDGWVNRRSDDGEYRILSFGDSFTFSVLDPEWSYNGIVQDRLQAAIQDQKFRVINLGEPATGTRHFRAAHHFWSQIFEHDAVLFHIFLGNDILDDAYLNASMEWAPNIAIFNSDNPILQAGNRLVPEKFPLRMMDYVYAWWQSERSKSIAALPPGYNWAARTSFDQGSFNQINFKFLENSNPAKLEALLAGYEQVLLLLRRAQEISEKGIKVAVVLGPSQPQVDAETLADALQANAADPAAYDLGLAQRIINRLHELAAPKVPLIDLSGGFRHYHAQSGEKLYFRQNTHWDKAGNRLAGEMIAEQLLQSWFDQPLKPRLHPESPTSNILFGAAEIDRYIEPLLSQLDPDKPVISGVVRAIQMLDGITDQQDNWAIVALNQPALIEFRNLQSLESMRLHLYDFDDRQYRFTVEAFQNGNWTSVADHSVMAVGGIREISLGDIPVSAIRITGLYNSAQENNPANAFLHILELEFIKQTR